MKTIFLTLSALAFIVVGCDMKRDITYPTATLASPILRASEYSDPFVGGLEIYATQLSTDVYVGNYTGEPLALSARPAAYVIGITGVVTANPKLTLPIGNYTLVYWGVPYDGDTTYKEPQVTSPGVSIGTNLGTQTLALRRYIGDSTYSPTYDYVYALRNIEIGRDSIDVPLRRVVAGLRVVARNSDGSPLNGAISSIRAQIGGISMSLNFFTAMPQLGTVDVAFPLTIADDRLSASNLTAMTFPSNPNPSLTLIITLANGTQHVLRTTLANALTANNRLTVDINLDNIDTSPDGGAGFQVSRWTETSEQITFSND